MKKVASETLDSEGGHAADSTNEEITAGQERECSPDIEEVYADRSPVAHRSRRGNFCQIFFKEVFNIEGEHNTNNPMIQGLPQLFTPGLLAELT